MMVTTKKFKDIYESIIGTEDSIQVDGMEFDMRYINAFDISPLEDDLWRVSIEYNKPMRQLYGIYEGTKEECRKIAYTIQNCYP